MLQFHEIKNILLNAQSLRYFKYWGDVMIDFLLIGLSMLVLLSWQAVFYSESAGLNCIPSDQDNTDLALSEGRYITSRCLIESPARFSLFYPYFEFLQFLTLLISHVMWLNIPTVKSKLDLYYDLLGKINEIEPKFGERDIHMVPALVLDPNNEEIHLIQDKLIFLITERSCIAKYYFIKNTMNLILTFLFMCLNGYWIGVVMKFGVDFSCDLSEGEGQKKYQNITCNVSPFYFFLGYIFLFQLMLFLILVLTIVNFIHFANVKYFQSNVRDMLGSGGDRLCGLPGYFDFALYLTLLNMNIKDGGFYIQMIKFVINIPTVKPLETEPVDAQRTVSKKFHHFSLELAMISMIAESLEFEVHLKPYKKENLYECIRDLLSTEITFQFKELKDIKFELLEEIKSNPLYYAFLFSGLTENDVEKLKETLQKLDTLIRDLEQDRIWPNNLILAAAANLYNIKIENNHFIDRISTFEPRSGKNATKGAVISLISPNYYNLFEPLYTNNREIIQKRIFRQKTLDKIQKQALSYQLSGEAKNPHKVKTNWLIDKPEARQNVYQEHFLQTIYSTSRLVASRFQVAKYNVMNEVVQMQ
ncbi:hypothetical protein RF11_12517 [Thelohanellus kitauei]|uniref:Uncharacterized protein n=1 Tax=Thelohanellus kitauei TaxID=669202 RepID=A0A0C2NA06_THEKT|nr:hypothetical protein RF11_12517 [Thelohanellus kitauei]